jgi:hypothetical protein
MRKRVHVKYKNNVIKNSDLFDFIIRFKVDYTMRARNRIDFPFAETFHINPQLHLILSEMEEVIVSLNQHSIMEPKVSELKKVQNPSPDVYVSSR